MTESTTKKAAGGRNGDEPERATNRRQDQNKARLAEQLRANLQRRKAQTRARRSGEADSRAEGLGERPDPAPDSDTGDPTR